MNRIDKKLENMRAKQKKILSPYLTAGDPFPSLTVDLMHQLVKSGADILELGIPFSDPMAEGPVIQAAMERALAHKVNTDDVLGMVEQFRKVDKDTPIVLMGYVNPIEQYGYERFAQRAREVGVDGTILVDLPPEESESVAPLWRQYQLHSIYLCSPTTSDKRLALIQQQASGYLYYVSLKGVTGSDNLDVALVKKQYQHLKSQVKLPLMVGFGIKTPQIAAAVADFADGVIVGAGLISAICTAQATNLDPIKEAGSFISKLRYEMDK